MERIIASNITKKFRKENYSGSLLKKMLLKKSEKRKRGFLVLDRISLNVNEGEIVGLIGKNGSGKSTLLRAIARIYYIDTGEIKANGNVISIINLGFGLHQNLSMKDNVYLGCALFGLKRREIREKFKDIVSFSELEDYVNTRLYQFSNGMLQRLAFSIAIHCNPEILLLDEVFEVGDEEFRKKSTERIRDLVKKGCSIVLTGHNMELMKRQCDRIIWIDKGKIVKEGKPEEVIKEYLSSS